MSEKNDARLWSFAKGVAELLQEKQELLEICIEQDAEIRRLTAELEEVKDEKSYVGDHAVVGPAGDVGYVGRGEASAPRAGVPVPVGQRPRFLDALGSQADAAVRAAQVQRNGGIE